jgi:tetratricopeptide (TPR) repeat protein
MRRSLAQPAARRRFFHPLVIFLILAVVVEAGLVALLWQRARPQLPPPTRPAPLTRSEPQGQVSSAGEEVKAVKPPVPSEKSIPQAGTQPAGAPMRPATAPSTPGTRPQPSAGETPGEPRALAEMHARAQRWDDAIASWKQALEMDPSSRREIEATLGEAFLQASAAALAAGREAEARMRLLEALEWVPERGEIRLRLAEGLFAQGEYREALDQYRAAVDLLPAQAADITTAMVRAYREWGHGLLRQGDFAAAANVFREALALDNDNGELYFAWGKAEFRQRAFDAAIQAFETAQTFAPGLRAEVEPYLTKALALLGGPQTAVIDFTPGSTRIEASVVVNGSLEIPFIIDTGAAVTLLPAWAAETLGYRPPPMAEWIWIQTAGGLRRLPYATVNRLEVQGLGLSNLSVIFGDLPGHEVSKGLLGMDFLRHFSLAVDHEVGRMTLRLK